MRKYTLVVSQDPEDAGELMGDVPALPGLHVGARSMDVLVERAREAIEAYLAGADLDDYPEETGTPKLVAVEVNVPSGRAAGVSS
jgi:predicted RNase H-like HicB family nuclease